LSSFAFADRGWRQWRRIEITRNEIDDFAAHLSACPPVWVLAVESVTLDLHGRDLPFLISRALCRIGEIRRRNRAELFDGTHMVGAVIEDAETAANCSSATDTPRRGRPKRAASACRGPE